MRGKEGGRVEAGGWPGAEGRVVGDRVDGGVVGGREGRRGVEGGVVGGREEG